MGQCKLQIVAHHLINCPAVITPRKVLRLNFCNTLQIDGLKLGVRHSHSIGCSPSSFVARVPKWIDR